MADFASGVISNIRFLLPALFLILLCTLTINFISLTSQHEILPFTSGTSSFTPSSPNSSSTSFLYTPPHYVTHSQVPLDQLPPDDHSTFTPQDGPKALEQLSDGISIPSLDRPMVFSVPGSQLQAKFRFPLIIYIYTESANSYANLLFFIQHGLHKNADFIFILNGKLKKEVVAIDAKGKLEKDGGYDYKSIWPKNMSSVRVMEREKGDCFQFGTMAEVLKMEGGMGSGRVGLREEKSGKEKLMDGYEKYILLSSKTKGPFVPRWSKDCWSEAYLGRIGGRVKLIGPTATCPSPNKPQLSSQIWATDSDGLSALLDPKAIGECFKSEKEQEAAEKRTMAFLIEEKKFEVDVMAGDVKCGGKRRGEGFGNRTLTGMGSVHPFETMFVLGPGGSKEEEGRLEELSMAQGVRKYSSMDVCGSH